MTYDRPNLDIPEFLKRDPVAVQPRAEPEKDDGVTLAPVAAASTAPKPKPRKRS